MAAHIKTFNFGADEVGAARIAAYEKAAAGNSSLSDWVKEILDKAAGFDENKVKKAKTK